MTIFSSGSVRPSYSVINSQVFEGPLQLSRFFSVTRTYVHVRWDVKEALNDELLHFCVSPVTEELYRIIYLFIWGFYVAFNTVQVISRRVVGRAEETSTYSSLGFCTVNCRPTASNYQLSHIRPSRGSNPGLRGGRRECYHSATVAPNCIG